MKIMNGKGVVSPSHPLQDQGNEKQYLQPRLIQRDGSWDHPVSFNSAVSNQRWRTRDYVSQAWSKIYSLLCFKCKGKGFSISQKNFEWSSKAEKRIARSEQREQLIMETVDYEQVFAKLQADRRNGRRNIIVPAYGQEDQYFMDSPKDKVKLYIPSVSQRIKRRFLAWFGWKEFKE